MCPGEIILQMCDYGNLTSDVIREQRTRFSRHYFRSKEEEIISDLLL